MSVGYDELLRRLFAARRAGVDWGTQRVRALLDALGAPDRQVGAIVHVGGTNGKGSTSAMIASVAAAAGARVGVYTSPHLSSLRERVRVRVPAGGAGRGGPGDRDRDRDRDENGDGDELLDEDAWCAAAERVWTAGGDALTFFEQITAIGLVLLAGARLDVCVLEVGLGGRLDATNAVDAPIAVVTGVAMDHQEYLGDTLRAIAGEKAGIWKRGQRVVVGASGEPEAVPWLVDAARAAGVAEIAVVDEAAIAAVPLRLGLAGAHQRANAAAALAAIDALEHLGCVRADAAARARGLASVRHAGRLEEIVARRESGDVGARLVLDGAHNPHGARALAAWMAAQPERPRAIVLAVSADKDVAAIVDALVPCAEQVVATRYGQPRSMEPSALRAIVAERAAVAVGRAEAAVDRAPLVVDEAPDVLAAIARARAAGAALVVVAGSLFVVGEARAALVGGPVDPIAVTDPVGRNAPTR